jgi:hypothetical protein
LFIVFQTLPADAATYISEWFFGFTAKSDIRPEHQAGPMLRKDKPPNVEEVRPATFFSVSFGVSFDVSFGVSFFFWASACHVLKEIAEINSIRIDFFMII